MREARATWALARPLPAVVCVAVVLATLAGSATAADQRRPRVRVMERGFTQVDRTLYAGAVLRNVGRRAAGDVEVRLTAVDASGVLLETARLDVEVIPARRTFNVGSDMRLEPGAQAARLRVEVSIGRALRGVRRIPRVTNARVAHADLGDLDVRAQVTNTLRKTLSALTDEFAVLRAADGRVVGGLHSFPDGDLPPGRDAVVEFPVLDPLPDVQAASVSVDAETTAS
jgi:hypothetical protein